MKRLSPSRNENLWTRSQTRKKTRKRHRREMKKRQ